MGLSFELRNFTGTEHYYKHSFGNLTYTDGIKYMAEAADAYWLIEAIASYQYDWNICEFQIWNLKVFPDDSAQLVMQEDDDEPRLVVQFIHYTDFPLKEIKLYVENGVLLLPSEH